jgi:hypothetical protein
MPFGLHAARCDWPVKPKFPLIPSHEGLGIVKEIGKDMTEVTDAVFLDINLPGRDGCFAGDATGYASAAATPGVQHGGCRSRHARLPAGGGRLPFEAVPLTDLMRWLSGDPFVRIGRHAVVNLQAIERVTHYGDRLYRVRLRDRVGTEIRASRTGAARLAPLLGTKR